MPASFDSNGRMTMQCDDDEYPPGRFTHLRGPQFDEFSVRLNVKVASGPCKNGGIDHGALKLKCAG
jgi:hypothetical protein